MDYISIAFLIIIIINLIVGLKKGFLVNLFDSTKKIGALLLAVFLAKVCAEMIIESGVGLKITTKFYQLLTGLNEGFTLETTLENKDVLLNTVWKYVPLPSSLSNSIKEVANSYIALGVGDPIGMYVGKSLGYHICILIGFVLVYLLATIILFFLGKLIKIMSKDQGGFSRLLGGLFGVFKALITCWIICYVINVVYSLMPSSGVGNFISDCLNSKLGVFKFLNEHNGLSILIEKFILN